MVVSFDARNFSQTFHHLANGLLLRYAKGFTCVRTLGWLGTSTHALDTVSSLRDGLDLSVCCSERKIAFFSAFNAASLSPPIAPSLAHLHLFNITFNYPYEHTLSLSSASRRVFRKVDLEFGRLLLWALTLLFSVSHCNVELLSVGRRFALPSLHF